MFALDGNSNMLQVAGSGALWCEECGITEWLGRPLPRIHIEHRNGDCEDHRLENVRFLCPNCFSQTPAGRLMQEVWE